MNNELQKDLIIVKVGTNVLARTEDGQEILDHHAFESIGTQVRELTDKGIGVILVSSGAITAGVLGDQQSREDVADKPVELQRYAARGWHTVVQKWESVIGDKRVSATLLTKHELHTEPTRSKALGVIACCLVHGDVFVVNENDTISDDEIKFGDNDTLAAALAVECAVSGLFRSVKLVLLTNKSGFNRVADDDSTLIHTVDDIDAVAHYAGDAENHNSRGGMKTKVQSAKVAKTVGVETVIANGRAKNAIQRALAGQIGTRFTA